MRKRKKIEIKKIESQKSYLDDIQTDFQEDQELKVRKSFIVSKAMDQKIRTLIYHKRTQGDVYYTQTDLLREALDTFLNMKK